MQSTHVLASACAAALLTTAASAQGLETVFVTDSSNDNVWRCADLNADGDYNDAGEVSEFYSDVLGTIPLSNNAGIRCGPDGTVYVCDTTEDIILAMRDLNGDGDANDAGEHWIFFDGRAGGNLSGVIMTSANSLTIDPASGIFWVASSNTASGGNDAVIRLQDLNADGDANDAGEASEFWTAPAGAPGDYLVNATAIGPDGKVYYMEGSTGVLQKGVYRLDDLNLDGDANDPGEHTAFFLPPPQAATAFMWCLEFGEDGWFYTADTSNNEIIWRFKDLNGDGDAHDPGEFGQFWVVGASSNMWDLTVAADGTVTTNEAQTPERMWKLRDTNANGVIEAGEVAEVYNETISPAIIGTGRGIDRARSPQSGLNFCSGDGTGTACPCGNAGAQGHGCASSVNAQGALLSPLGQASLAADTLALLGSGMPNSSALYFQGTTRTAGGAGLVFGDGLRCVGGTIVRLGLKVNAAGASRYPVGADLPISVRGLIGVPGTRTYQIWYRNSAAFCNPETFNLSNGVEVSWTP